MCGSFAICYEKVIRKGATLYVKNEKKTVAQKRYAKESIQTIKIKPQKESKAVKKPIITAKTIKSTDAKVKVKAFKGTKLYIKNDSNKAIKTVKYAKDGTKSISIPQQRDSKTLYFYLANGNKRSAIVKKPVRDVTAPAKSSISEKTATSLLVKGEVGSAVYVKYGTKSAYTQKGIITSKSGKLVAGLKPDNKGYYYVKLKDASGNASAVTKVKSKYFKKPGGSSSNPEDPMEPEVPTVEYSYTVTPLLPPFNEFFYVQTEDPDPSEIRFVDKSSIYYTDGQELAYLKPTEVRFMDVAYENKATGRVKGGYIFAMGGSGLDGGNW